MGARKEGMEGGRAKLKTLTEQGEGGGDWESFRHGELFLQMES